jgi:uncharacterized protein YecT (DUF1311 family)
MKRTVFMYMLASLFLTVSAMADESAIRDFAAPHKERCAAMCSIGLSICMAEEYKASDGRLNEVVQELTAEFKSRNQLKRAQQAWLKYRDAQCKLAASGYSPKTSEHYYALNVCLIDLTEKRLLELENISRTVNAGAAKPL